jgi:hypothetical protein
LHRKTSFQLAKVVFSTMLNTKKGERDRRMEREEEERIKRRKKE